MSTTATARRPRADTSAHKPLQKGQQTKAAIVDAALGLATQIGLEPMFPNEENPFPWMSEMIDLKKERNFFETRVIEYQTGGALSWD